MGKDSNIAWTDHTWNPWQGCHKVSDGCKNCYMFRDKKRYGQDASIVIRSKDATFNKPLYWKDPAKVFVCSWSDFWIKEADEWRGQAFNVIKQTPYLTYLLLTKRPELIDMRWRDFNNVWLGATIESKKAKDRIGILRKHNAIVNFLSIEPLIGDVGYLFLDNVHSNINWIIVGAESGPDRRPCKTEWVRSIVKQCKEAGVPVFVKQLHINGKVSSDINDWPEDLRIQEFPIG